MRRRRVAAGFALLALMSAACAQPTPGGLPASPPGPAGDPVALSGRVNNTGQLDETAVRGTTLNLDIQAGDNFFTPTFIRTVAGATILVTVKNIGVGVHTFTISGSGVNIVLTTPGESGTATFVMPVTGSLTFVCTYHRAIGMQGALYVG